MLRINISWQRIGISVLQKEFETHACGGYATLYPPYKISEDKEDS